MGNASGKSSGAAKFFKGSAAVVTFLLSVFGGFLAYEGYQRSSLEHRKAEAVIQKIVVLKSHLYSFNETVKFLLTRWSLEQSGQTEEQLFELIEEAYKSEVRKLADAIGAMEADGTLLFLFNPGDEVFVRLIGLRNWCSVDAMKAHPLHSRNGEIVGELTIGQENLKAYAALLENLSQFESASLRDRVVARMRDLQMLDDHEEIRRLQSILGGL